MTRSLQQQAAAAASLQAARDWTLARVADGLWHVVQDLYDDGREAGHSIPDLKQAFLIETERHKLPGMGQVRRLKGSKVSTMDAWIRDAK